MLFSFVDGHDDHLVGGDLRGEDEAIVIAVRHHQCPDEAGADAPAGGPNVVELVLFIRKLHFKCFGEILSEEMGGPGLQGLAILHQGLDAISVHGSGETFTL